MAKRDEETGVSPQATDGEVDEDAQREADQLALARARKRAEEEARSNASDAAAAEALGGAAIDGQQAIDTGDEPGEEDDGQMFIWDAGRKVTLAQLAARGVSIEHAFVFGGKRMKGAGQLVAWDDDVIQVVRGRPSQVKLVPTRDDQERLTKVTIETHVAVKSLRPADSDEAMEILAPVFESLGVTDAVQEALVKRSRSRAAA